MKLDFANRRAKETILIHNIVADQIPPDPERVL
jgi:hypothetical protein